MKHVALSFAVIALFGVGLYACSAPPTPCKNDSECPSAEFCQASSGSCQDRPDSGTTGGGTGGSTGGGTGGGSTGGGTGGGSTGGGTGGSNGGGTGGGSGNCAPGEVCRAKAGDCDVAELCDSSGACPAEVLIAVGTVCRAPAGPCDLDERCSGTSAQCPADTLSPASTVCRSSAGGCDPAENCSGASPQCPADALAPATTVCRAPAGMCDVGESCTGSLAACPADVFVASGTTCRAAGGVCDLPELCTGSGSACPPDLLVSAGTSCRASVSSCDIAETCNGTAVSCPGDAFQPGTLECAAQSCTAGVTTPARLCAGNSSTCNSVTTVSCNGYQCSGTTCRTTCGSSADCLSTHFCQPGNQCAPKRIDGTSCTGTANGFECVSGSCTGSYVDGDGDNFGTGTIGFFCGTAAPTGRSLNNTDCCDSDNRARPNQTTPQSTARTTCGGFDFNCNGTTTITFLGANACQSIGACSTGDRDCTGDTGWLGAQPACGATGTYVTVCGVSATCAPSTCPGCVICNATTQTRPQTCL